MMVIEAPKVNPNSGEAELNGRTLLKDIDMPALELVLDEIFGVPPAALFPQMAQPQTVAELAAQAGLDVAAVTSRIKAIKRMGQHLEISPQELETLMAQSLPEGELMLIDVREEWEFDVCHLAGSLLLGREDFTALLPKLRQARHVVTICHLGVRSMSAAMYLRQHGVGQARSLSGGVELWAKTVDDTMARY